MSAGGTRSEYTVLWHPAAEAERDISWPEAEIRAMDHAAKKLEASGVTLGHPHSSAVRGSPLEGLRELRPRAGRSRWRPLYVQAGKATFVVLAVAPEAQIDKRGYAAAVRRAAVRFAEVELAG